MLWKCQCLAFQFELLGCWLWGFGRFCRSDGDVLCFNWRRAVLWIEVEWWILYAGSALPCQMAQVGCWRIEWIEGDGCDEDVFPNLGRVGDGLEVVL